VDVKVELPVRDNTAPVTMPEPAVPNAAVPVDADVTNQPAAPTAAAPVTLNVINTTDEEPAAEDSNAPVATNAPAVNAAPEAVEIELPETSPVPEQVPAAADNSVLGALPEPGAYEDSTAMGELPMAGAYAPAAVGDLPAPGTYAANTATVNTPGAYAVDTPASSNAGNATVQSLGVDSLAVDDDAEGGSFNSAAVANPSIHSSSQAPRTAAAIGLNPAPVKKDTDDSSKKAEPVIVVKTLPAGVCHKVPASGSSVRTENSRIGDSNSGRSSQTLAHAKDSGRPFTNVCGSLGPKIDLNFDNGL
jgi:hypothetical protein